ncbi:MAG: DNA polymerase III subunit chi [Gammaproteobacteria bacterium]|nr:DNA polymerase III subunit chi [Gammaproteobacteria bacterium]NNM13491.1 DNA polymerase III subunit chi [Gammaproteobacteria bacterium]
MTQVDFYIIPENQPRSKDVVTCRLTEKALKQGFRVLILGQDQKQLQALDEKLWTYKEQSFIPHEIEPENAITSEHCHVVLSENSNAYTVANLLINLSGKIPEGYARFERIAEIVPGKQQDRQQSRVRYKQYREQSCTLNTHEL